MVNNPRGPGRGFPQSAKTQHTYGATVSLDPGLASYASHSFRANSLFDPDLTGAGHQPLGFDQYNAIYSQYTVTKTRIKVTVLKDDAADGVPGVVAVLLRDSRDVAVGNVDTVDEMVEYATRSAYRSIGSLSASCDPRSSTFYMDFDAKKWFNTAVIGVPEYSGVGANPIETPVFQLYYYSVNANNPDPMQFLIEMTFDTVWTLPKSLLQS